MTKPRKYTNQQLQEAVTKSLSYADVLRNLGLAQAGGTQAYIKKRIELDQLDISHFKQGSWNKGGTSWSRKKPDDILVLLPEGSFKTRAYLLRRALVEKGVPKICSAVGCNISNIWNNLPIELEIDHINGNFLDNRIENLQFLCPNCHYQKTIQDKQARVSKLAKLTALEAVF